MIYKKKNNNKYHQNKIKSSQEKSTNDVLITKTKMYIGSILPFTYRKVVDLCLASHDFYPAGFCVLATLA